VYLQEHYQSIVQNKTVYISGFLNALINAILNALINAILFAFFRKKGYDIICVKGKGVHYAKFIS